GSFRKDEQPVNSETIWRIAALADGIRAERIFSMCALLALHVRAAKNPHTVVASLSDRAKSGTFVAPEPLSVTKCAGKTVEYQLPLVFLKKINAKGLGAQVPKIVRQLCRGSAYAAGGDQDHPTPVHFSHNGSRGERKSARGAGTGPRVGGTE